MNKRKKKRLQSRNQNKPFTPAVSTHLLIKMPQTYTVSPGGDTVDAMTPHCAAVLSHQWPPGSILFFWSRAWT